MRESVKDRLERNEYTLETANNCVRVLSRSDLKIEDFLLVVNLTTNNILYNFSCDGLGGTVNNTGDLIFEKSLTSYLNTDGTTVTMLDSDDLSIHFAVNQRFRGGSKNDIPVFVEHLVPLLEGIKDELSLIRMHQEEADDTYFKPEDINT